jgi:Kef-type K+ transport system membrane component KefB
VEDSPLALVVILGAAVLAPALAELVRRFRIPSVVFELLLGIAIGPQVLGWADLSPFVTGLSNIGLAFLFFLAGYEIDPERLRGGPLNRAVTGWGISLAGGLAVGGILMLSDVVVSSLLIGLALTTTAVGTLLPMLRDRGILETPFGTQLLAAGAVGEFGPIVAITLLLSGHNPAHEAAVLLAFVVIAAGAAWFASRPQPPGVVEVLGRHFHSSTQLPVRIIVLLMSGMLLLAYELGLDTLLGAFTAGLLVRLIVRPDQEHELEPRLEALGFGFLIPIFFVVSGMNFDLDALLGSSTAMMRVPIFLALLLAVRGLPALLVYRRELPRAQARLGMAFLQATALPLIVVITQIGLQTDRMQPENAAALMGAAMLSVLIFPLVGFALEARGRDVVAPEATPVEP